MNKLPKFTYEVVVWLFQDKTDKFYVFVSTDEKLHEIEKIAVGAVRHLILDGWRIQNIICQNFKFAQNGQIKVYDRERWRDE